MTYRQWMAARELLAQEFLGRYARAQEHAEDRQFQASTGAVRRSS